MTVAVAVSTAEHAVDTGADLDVAGQLAADYCRGALRSLLPGEVT